MICSCAWVILAPIDQNSQETKHHQAAAIASRLLKELAEEQLINKYQQENESEIEKLSDETDEDFEYISTTDGLYPAPPTINGEDVISDANDTKYDLPINDLDLMNDLEEQQLDEDIVSILHTPTIDDSTMKVENHS
ncbi:unnamed protein product [Rotaria socialis]|uniref:Uncharacterized protein n=1 Tax=Rotaria socialis TaxID=392032 RepID=A0A818B6U1_9BILA|nr:unnamed protein product [Rotaria socialis]CAF3399968.1 unnamed protein product [Rotaria socialis]CAF3412800.1 unnamed protein product [Rotaria socialis]CAF3498216.1 unnamed protein product [Rotaria socialis]CAF4164603.1 unnamed protein product [Rotaria socialis]